MAKPQKTIEELRATANARAKRYQQAQRDRGKKHLTVFVSQEVSDIIAGQREKTGATVAKVVETAIMVAYGKPELVDIPQAHQSRCKSQKPSPELDPVPVKPSAQLVDAPMKKPLPPQPVVDQGKEPGIPDCHGKNLTMDKKDSILIKAVELYPGRNNAQKRADVLNQAGVPCGNGEKPWNSKKVMDNFRHALKRKGRS
jgi:hypothetical protein